MGVAVLVVVAVVGRVVDVSDVVDDGDAEFAGCNLAFGAVVGGSSCISGNPARLAGDTPSLRPPGGWYVELRLEVVAKGPEARAHGPEVASRAAELGAKWATKVFCGGARS